MLTSSELQIKMVGISQFYYYQFNMKIAIICIALIFSTYSTVILQSPFASTTITSPFGASVVGSSMGREWIQSSIAASQVTYQSLFYSRCIGSANITISVSTSFSIYLNGVLVGSGPGSQSYIFNWNLSCGNQNLTIVVSGPKFNGFAPVSFAINQDQSGCFNCNSNGFWNEKTCSCQCISSKADCPCVQPKVWRDYPTCGCRCPGKVIWGVATDLKAADESVEALDYNADNGDAGDEDNGAVDAAKLSILPFPWICPRPRYYDQLTCKCICHYKYCKAPTYFDPLSCSCRRRN